MHQTSQMTTTPDPKPGHTVEDLNRLYTEGESADQLLFTEMRSNLLLVAGEHYQKRDAYFFRRIRDSRELNQEQKLRLTKNHIRKICQTYVNNIMSASPGVGFEPKNEKELHDQKVAEMHHAVWRDAFDRHNVDDLMDDWCDNFVEIGECAVKIFFDPSLGPVVAHHQAMDAEGNPAFDEMGQMVPDHERPVRAGDFVFEEVYGFNLLRPQECKDLRKAEWLGLRKMVGVEELKLSFPDPDTQKFIKESMDGTFQVFDAAQGGYHKSKNQVEVREYYFRACGKYPEGLFYISTKAGILASGPLPGGIYPIQVQLFDKIQTTPRGRSPIKQMRPYQAEINRSASKMAEHQITLGDDKLLIQNGTKVSASVALPGIRGISYTGGAPTILEGRSGAQYLEYMNSQISEMYQVMNVAEDGQEDTANLDPYVLLYRSARQKKKFQRGIKRFEKFLVNVVKTYLSLAKVHLDDRAIIYAVGKQDQVNIPEFKSQTDLCYEIKVEAQSEDIESKLGKQIVLNHALQYIGPQLKPDQIGKIMRSMPFSNIEASFDDLTIDSDNAVNDILALERGEQPPVNEYDDHPYMIKRLTSRMRMADFKLLPPNVQQNMQMKSTIHQQMEAIRIAKIQRAEQGFIPTGGYLVKLDFYMDDPKNPSGKTQRAQLPYESVAWLMKQLEVQGQSQEQLSNMNAGAQAQLADQVSGLIGRGQSPSQPPMASPPMGNTHGSGHTEMSSLLNMGPAAMGQGVGHGAV